MSNHIEVTGTVWGVFGHRCALETADGKVLADIGPGLDAGFTLVEGDRITVQGDRRPSEIKVDIVVTADGRRHRIGRPRKPDHPAPIPADPELALRSLRIGGYVASAEPKRRPKHWEISAHKDNRTYELHVELDGHIRSVRDRSPAVSG